MKTHYRAVVIGGGIVGSSTLYHLAKMGWKDVVLLEKNEYTSGSTWHAAGLLPLFNMSYSVGKIHKYSVDLYQRLEAETGQPVSFHKTGNLRLARNQERMDEYRRYCGTASTIGVPFEVIGPDEIKKLWGELKVLNLKLWEIEDGKRLAEKNKKFDESFIELARNVYKCNDMRAKIKSKINQLSGSNIREVKQYTKY